MILEGKCCDVRMMWMSNLCILNLNITLRFINLTSAAEITMRPKSCSVRTYPRTCSTADPTLSPARRVRPPCSQRWRLRPLDLLSCCSWNAVKANSCLNGPLRSQTKPKSCRAIHQKSPTTCSSTSPRQARPYPLSGF